MLPVREGSIMSKQTIAAIAACISALVLVGCVLTKRWFHTEFRAGHVDIGLLSAESCFDGACQSQQLSDSIDEELSTFVTAAKLTFVLGLLSAGLLVISSLFGLLRHARAPQLAKLTLLLLCVAICVALVLLIKRPQLANASLGVFLFMAGGMAGVISAQMLASSGAEDETTRDPTVPRL